MAILLAEHRLERCLAAADRVIAMDVGAISFDGSPATSSPGPNTSDPALDNPRRAPLLPRRHRPRCPSVYAMRAAPWTVKRSRSSGGWRRGADSAARRLRRASLIPARERSRARSSAQGKEGAPRRDPPAGALTSRDLWVELTRGDCRPRRPPRHRPTSRPRRARRADGPQRRRQEHAAADRRRPGRPGPRQGRDAGRHRAADPEPERLPGPRAGRRRAAGGGGAAALRIVGLEHAVDADPRDLSGGERQRLALAIALAGRMEGEELPGLVALDEPTRGMDRARKDDLVELIDGPGRARGRRGAGRHPRRRVRGRLRRARRPARRRRCDRRRPGRRRCSPAAGTSRPRSRGCSTCPG